MIIGASFDTVEAQKNFADEQGFPYRLLADTDKVMGTAYLAVQRTSSTRGASAT